MNIVGIFIAAVVVFGALQAALNFKTKKTLIKCLPMCILAAGLIFCLLLYTDIFRSLTPSAAAENRYFAAFLAPPLAGALAGCFLGSLFSTHVIKSRT